jgi:malonyl-CoA/methylmalonyl-CoA synthetase
MFALRRASDNLFLTFARAFPGDRSAPLLITPDGKTFSYRAMEEETARLARLLTSRGLRPGDRVSAQVPKSPAAVWLYLACLRAGLVFHPLNDAYKKNELAYLLSDAEPRLAVCDPCSVELFEALLADRACQVLTLDEHGTGSLTELARTHGAEFETQPREAADLAALLYTSGTTGQPKGAMLTHGNLASNARALIEAWGFSAADRLLHALPFFHAHGLFVGLGCTLGSGASMVLLPQFATETVIEWLPRCTVLMGVPTYYARLLASGRLNRMLCSQVRLFISGSAPLPAEVFKAFAGHTGHEILERYGMTETGMISSNPLGEERRAGSVGRPLAGVTVRIAGRNDEPLPTGQTGEVQVQGANVFPGYWRRPDHRAQAFTADGFFCTGDLGWLSADGYLTIAGRSKDLIITGGLNVYPREVENVIDSLPGVAESAVFGVAHSDFGEAVIAVVVTKPTESATEAGILGALRDRLAGFKVPKRVFVVEQLPRNAMGKIQKTVLRQRFADTFSN